MSGKRKWDLASPRSLDAAAEWLRAQADAQLVIVIRAGDVAFALHPQIKASDALAMVEVALPDGMRELEARRLEAKAKKRPKAKPELADEKWNEMRRERGL